MCLGVRRNLLLLHDISLTLKLDEIKWLLVNTKIIKIKIMYLSASPAQHNAIGVALICSSPSVPWCVRDRPSIAFPLYSDLFPIHLISNWKINWYMGFFQLIFLRDFWVPEESWSTRLANPSTARHQEKDVGCSIMVIRGLEQLTYKHRLRGLRLSCLEKKGFQRDLSADFQ